MMAPGMDSLMVIVWTEEYVPPEGEITKGTRPAVSATVLETLEL